MSSETGTVRVSKTMHLETSRIRFPDSGMRFFEAPILVGDPCLAAFARKRRSELEGWGF
jgi:hypothetical protein